VKTMRSRKETSLFESYSLENATLLHRCPVCGTQHEVSAARAQFAYGRQLACNPDCEAERRRRNRASYGIVPATVVGDRDDRDCRYSTLRLVGSGDHKAVLSVTVESTDVLRVRRAIFQTGGESVGILKATPVPHSSRIRMFIGMKHVVLESIMIAIMRSVDVCEFGRVART
jgi:hypothetical protein